MPVSISRYKNFQRRTHVYKELFVEHVLCISSWKKKTPSLPNIILYYITAPRLNKKYIAPGHQNLAGEFCVVGGEFSDLRCLMNTLLFMSLCYKTSSFHHCSSTALSILISSKNENCDWTVQLFCKTFHLDCWFERC